MLSLGSGYYEFSFASDNDLRTIWAMGTVNLKPGLLRLFEWTQDFNLHTQRNTHAQVWIRLMALPQEYWMERTSREISSAVGTPLLIYNATTKRIFGHYPRILVDMDFSRKIYYEIFVEREGYAFPVEVVYERIPDFCTHYQTIGHDVTACRWLYPRKEKDTDAAKETVAQGKKPVPTKRLEWVPLQDNPSGIGSSAAFQAQPTPKVVENVTNLQQQKQPTAQPTPTVMENVTALQQQQQPMVQSTPMVVGNVL